MCVLNATDFITKLINKLVNAIGSACTKLKVIYFPLNKMVNLAFQVQRTMAFRKSMMIVLFVQQREFRGS